MCGPGSDGVGELWELAKIAIGWVTSPVITLIFTGTGLQCGYSVVSPVIYQVNAEGHYVEFLNAKSSIPNWMEC
jgi:hypothetical protein